MPTVGKKKYPYTKAGKAAAKAGAKALKKVGKAAGKALVTTAKKSKTGKSLAKAALTGAVAGAGAGKLLKGGRKKAAMKKRLPKGLGRTPAQIARIKAGGRNAKKKRKAGKGHQK